MGTSESVCWCVLWHETLQPSVQVSPVLALQFPFRKQKSATCRDGWTQLKEQKKTGDACDWDAQYHSFPWGSLVNIQKYTHHFFTRKTVPGRGLCLTQDHVLKDLWTGMLGSRGGGLCQSCFQPFYYYQLLPVLHSSCKKLAYLYSKPFLVPRLLSFVIHNWSWLQIALTLVDMKHTLTGSVFCTLWNLDPIPVSWRCT